MKISIQDIINSGANVTIAVSASDLRDFARAVVEQTKHELEATIAESKSEVYYTAEQVMSIFSITRRTLFRWQKEGGSKYLMPIKVGGLTRYRKSDIEKILNAR